MGSKTGTPIVGTIPALRKRLHAAEHRITLLCGTLRRVEGELAAADPLSEPVRVMDRRLKRIRAIIEYHVPTETELQEDEE